IPSAVIITSGFGEIGRRAEEEELLSIARRSGLRLIGPNCAGIMNPHARLFASIEVRALPGDIAFITQSGAVGGAVLAMAEERGIGFSRFVSYGNRADIGEIELLEYLESDPDTGTVAMYVESLQDGRAFMERARSLARAKPLILIKAGRTSAGSRAAGSHTGSMAGSDEVFDAMVRETGALRVAGLEEMLDLCQGFSMLPPVKGRRLAVVTNSGGPGILTSDHAEETGLQVAVPEDAERSALASFLPGHASTANPIDLTVEGTEDDYRRSLETLLSGSFDSAVAINVATPFLDSSGLARGIADAAESAGKPVAAVFMAGRIVESGARLLRERGVPAFPTGERAAEVLAAMARYEETRQSSGRTSAEKKQRPSGHEEPAAKPPAADPGEALAPPVLMPRALDLLRDYGFSLPKYRFIPAGGDSGTEAAELQSALRDLSPPLAMKVVSPSIVHKSDEGGVALNLRTRADTEAAFFSMKKRLQRRDFRGVILHELIPSGPEIILGMKRDPAFGPVILAGAGGIYTEVMRDVSLRIAPVNPKAAAEMLRELKVYPLLTGYRGTAALDVDDLARQIVLLSELATDHPEISELDLNPLFVLENRAVVGDVHIEVQPMGSVPKVPEGPPKANVHPRGKDR
ncbi:MAG: acetate--CoA ligase family protein, partial [Spirochaetota bacterium]|nr:acetate--CoA ligase family protein [Spirochaetota bacterium]